MENHKFDMFNQMVKYNVNQISGTNNNNLNNFNEEKADFVQCYLLIKKIQELNELWEVIINSRKNNCSNRTFDILMHTSCSSRQTANDSQLILENLNDESNWNNATQKMKENILDTHYFLSSWTLLFPKIIEKIDTQEISTQTECVKNSVNNSKTKTTYAETVKNSTQNLNGEIPSKYKISMKPENAYKNQFSASHLTKSITKMENFPKSSHNSKMNAPENFSKKLNNQHNSSQKSFVNDKYFNIATTNYFDILNSPNKVNNKLIKKRSHHNKIDETVKKPSFGELPMMTYKSKTHYKTSPMEQQQFFETRTLHYKARINNFKHNSSQQRQYSYEIKRKTP